MVGNGGLLRYGPQALLSYAEGFGREPLVCDLAMTDGSQPPGSAPAVLLEAGPLKVGVVGATDYYWQYDSLGLVERGRVSAVRAAATDLRANGADVVVLLSHCGEDADAALSWQLRGLVDLAVGGHSHDPFPEGRRDRGLPMAHAGCFGQYLGRILLDIGEDGVSVTSMTLEEIDPSVAGDPAVVAEHAAAKADVETWLDEPVGELARAAPDTGHSDSPAAHLVVEALLKRFPADVGLLICAHVERGLPAGTVRRTDVFRATSSPGNPATGTVTGSKLLRMLDTGTSDEYAARTPRTFRGRPYGGLAVVGAERVDGTWHVAGHPVDPAATYRVTSSDLELNHHGGLMADDVADAELDSSVILPELLEAQLRG